MMLKQKKIFAIKRELSNSFIRKYETVKYMLKNLLY